MAFTEMTTITEQLSSVRSFRLFIRPLIDIFKPKGCWIKPTYLAAQIVTEYLWVWLAGLVMLVLYSIMFLLMRGWIGEKKAEGRVENHELAATRQQVVAEDEQSEAGRTKKVAQKML
jgi:hypothetical protein